ncbi:MAG: glycosyltransferase, partial [Bacteroidia bacterium]
MAFFFSIIFIVSLFCILHTYIFYPLWMIVFTSDKEQNEIQFKKEDELPTVDILFAAYNEEAVLEGKLESMLKTNYPKDKIRIFVGSDASTDRTNEIVKKFAETNSNIHLIDFPGRTGKSGIINALAEQATADVFILTDANVIFFEDTIFNLIKHFKNNDVAQIAANIIKVSPKKEGIASQEMNYIQMENKIKYAESRRWNIVMGAEGGCYAIRKEYYAPVPKNFYM